MDNNSAYYPASDQLGEDDYARSGPQSVSQSGNDNKVLPTSKYLSHSLSLPNVVDGPSLEQQHHYNPQQFQSQPHYQQQQYQHYQRAHSSVADISNMSSVGSIFNNLSLDQPASTESRVYHQPLTGSREAFTEPTVKRGLHRTPQGGGGGLNTDSFARSCPQTEMERLKSRYLREKSNSLSHNSSHSSIDLTGLQPLETLQDVKSYDSDEDYDVVSPFNDFSIDYFSPNGSRVSQGGFLDSPVRRGLQRTNSHGSNGGFYPYTFARSCPQTEMERLKAEYLKEKTSYQSHNSSHSSIDVGGLQQQQPMRQSQSQLQSHQSSSSYQHQNIRRYDSDEDDDVLLLNFNSPLTDMSLENMSPKDSRVIQPPISSNRDNFTDPSLRRGMPRTSSHGGGGFIPETFARSCPQTEMERLKAHYMKERLSGSSVDNQAFNHKKMLQHSNSYSSRSAFPVPPSGTGTDYHNSSLLGLSNRDAHSLNYRGNSSHMHDRNDNFSDQKFGNRKYSSPIPKEKTQVNHNRDNREFSNNDLGVFTFDSGGTFSDKVSASQRENVFNCIKASKAQIILLSNTALKTEDQLQVVRAEVKTFFPCESAMWASFSSDELPDEAQSGELSQDSNNVTGRGVIILVLGPLAPRTGWIKSDSSGCVISASARIKPNLPVLTFTACDFGGALADKRMDHSSLDFLRDLVETEYEKDNIIIMGGNLSGDIGKPPTESSCCMTTPISGWIESRGVNVSIVCNSSTPTKKSGCFSEDVVVCQKKKSMTILGVDVTDSFSSNDCAATLPVLVKLSISGWPKKSYAVQVKAKQIAKSDAPSFPEKCQWSNKVDSNIRGTSQSQLNTRSKLMSDLLNWQKNLQDFSHNLQGILHASIDKSVRFKCLQQLLTDILNRGHSDSERLDTPGFANTIYLSHLSSLLALPEDDFLAKSTDIEQVIGSWHSAVSLSISSADALP